MMKKNANRGTLPVHHSQLQIEHLFGATLADERVDDVVDVVKEMVVVGEHRRRRPAQVAHCKNHTVRSKYTAYTPEAHPAQRIERGRHAKKPQQPSEAQRT